MRILTELGRFAAAALAICCTLAPFGAVRAQQAAPWQTSLASQLESLRRVYGDQPLDLLVVHLGITQRDEDAIAVARAMTDATGFPTIALPSYMKMPESEIDPPESDLFKALSQYLARSSRIRVGYADAWREVLHVNPGHRIVGGVFYSGSGIRANTAERDEILAVVEEHPDRVCGTYLWAMTDLKRSTEQAFSKLGLRARHVGKGDLVSHLTRPAHEHLVRSGKGNVLGLGTVLGWIVKKGPLALTKDLDEHSLTVRGGAGETIAMRAAVVDALELPPVACAEPVQPNVGSGPFVPEDLGGIDLGSEIRFRYLEERTAKHELRGAQPRPAQLRCAQLRCAMHGQSKAPVVEFLRGSRLAWESFFVFLALPENTFWVNLNPAEPDRIVDSGFGPSAAAHVMLASDLRLKVDLARFTHPDDEVTGKAFWAALDERARRPGGRRRQRLAPLSFRVWITPGEVVIATREEDSRAGACVVAAPLRVQLESDLRRARGDGGPKAQSPDQAFAEALFRRLILPRLQRAVDEAPEYRLLREVFYARVLAAFYEQSGLAQRGAFAALVDTGAIEPWRYDWDPGAIYQRYLKSVREGEYDLRRTHTSRNGRVTTKTTRTYFMGGIVFDDVPLTKVPLVDFFAREDQLRVALDRAIVAPTGVPVPDGAWAGGALSWPIRSASLRGR